MARRLANIAIAMIVTVLFGVCNFVLARFDDELNPVPDCFTTCYEWDVDELGQVKQKSCNSELGNVQQVECANEGCDAAGAKCATATAAIIKNSAFWDYANAVLRCKIGSNQTATVFGEHWCIREFECKCVVVNGTPRCGRSSIETTSVKKITQWQLKDSPCGEIPPGDQ
jgi:hypothetical protein